MQIFLSNIKGMKYILFVSFFKIFILCPIKPYLKTHPHQNCGFGLFNMLIVLWWRTYTKKIERKIEFLSFFILKLVRSRKKSHLKMSVLWRNKYTEQATRSLFRWNRTFGTGRRRGGSVSPWQRSTQRWISIGQLLLCRHCFRKQQFF